MKYLPRRLLIGLVFILFICLVFLGYKSLNATKKSSSDTIQVIAGENFWGSLVSQIGGSKVHVVSIVSDPNADPHEYESNNVDAREFSTANYVILNGAGYDSWGDKLLGASPNPNRKVLDVASLLGKKDGDNPHFWYNPIYVNKVIVEMEQNLASISPSNSDYFKNNLTDLQNSLAIYQARIATIKKDYSGVKVAATEDIFSYLASAAGLDLVSPPAFIRAVAEGNDPPANSIVEFQQQLQSGQIKLLVYNEQTVTPLTNNMKLLATEQNIPIVGVNETIQPPDVSFQDWMNSQLIDIQNALNAKALGN